MTTDRQIGSKGQHSGKPTLGFSRSPRRASSPRYVLLPPIPATDRRSLIRLRQARSCGPFASDFPCSTSGERLIANLELEFNSTHRKHSPLKISNRKFLGVFRLDFSSLGRTSSERSGSAPSNSTLLPVRSSPGCQPPTTAFLIYGSAIKGTANPQGFNNVQFSNRR
jgi:hypothetical protein